MHPPARRSRTAFLAVVAGLMLGGPVLAAPPAACPPPKPAAPPAARKAPARDLPTHVVADEVRGRQDGVSEFSGNVEFTRGPDLMRADRVAHDSETDLADATGNVYLRNDVGDSYRTGRLHMHLESHRGYAESGTYTLGRNDARGDMRRVEFLDQDHALLRGVRYTTCVPGQDDWFLNAREIEIDNVAEIATARHIWVDFMGKPVYYIPRGSFSISDKRKSGFLTPSFGYTQTNGADVAVPYYFNLAPNYDDTLTPRLLWDRGLQLQNEFRYLTRRSGGKLELEVLPSDKLRERNRYAGYYTHAHTFDPLWSANVEVRGVSDKYYLGDFGTNLGTSSLTHLPQNAEVNYRGPRWTFTAKLNDYQTVDSSIRHTERPYGRLPQLLLSTNPQTLSDRLQYDFSGEAVRFYRDLGLTGNRLNLIPAASYPILRPYGFFTPKLGLRYIGYQLSGTADTAPSVARPFLAVDSGLYFDRDTEWGTRLHTQTLEPRLYYLYVPHKDQDHLPNFDTGAPGLAVPNLFREQVFDGGDRIGDANQLTLAVTTRFIDQTDGAERVRGTIGRIFYFDDRKVNLPAGSVIHERSDIAGEAVANLPGNWYFSGSLLINRDTHEIRQSSYYLQYNPARNKIINFGQTFTRNETHQRDVSVAWPVRGHWSVRARAIDSLREYRDLESSVGVEYDACCWQLRALLKRRWLPPDGTLVNPYGKHDKLIFFEIELTGLTKYSRGGDMPDSPLRQGVFTSWPRSPEIGIEPRRPVP